MTVIRRCDGCGEDIAADNDEFLTLTRIKDILMHQEGLEFHNAFCVERWAVSANLLPGSVAEVPT